MATDKKSTSATSPLPKRKGGAIFPRISLKDAVGYANRLVAKTHTGPQPASVILTGVFDATGSRGQIRASAVKQFDLLTGKSDAYTATTLAKQITAAPEEEKPALLAKACLRPKVFRALYDTFHGDSVSVAKLRQATALHNVHPDEAENCARLFAESVAFAGLGSFANDTLQLVSAAELPHDVGAGEAEESGETGVDEEEAQTDHPPAELPKQTNDGIAPSSPGSARSVIQINIALDSSLDTEKLERQLELLRRYGAL